MFSSHDGALEDTIVESWLTSVQVDWMDKHMNQMWNGVFNHCGGVSGFDSNTRWHGMNW